MGMTVPNHRVTQSDELPLELKAHASHLVDPISDHQERVDRRRAAADCRTALRAEQGSPHDVDQVAPVSQLLSDQRRGRKHSVLDSEESPSNDGPKRFHLSIASQRPRGSVIATRPGPPKRTSCEAISSPLQTFGL